MDNLLNDVSLTGWQFLLYCFAFMGIGICIGRRNR